MGSEKLKIARTDADNLVANLRGEVGEVITTWLLMRHFMEQAARLASGDLAKDVANRDLLFLNLLADKLRDELIGRLSELAEPKVGQLTFYFAAKKLRFFQGCAWKKRARRGRAARLSRRDALSWDDVMRRLPK